MTQLNNTDLLEITETLIAEYCRDYRDLITMNLIHNLSAVGSSYLTEIACDISQIDFNPFDLKDTNYPKIIPAVEGNNAYDIIKRNSTKKASLPMIESTVISPTSLVTYFSGNGLPRNRLDTELKFLRHMFNNGTNKIYFSDLKHLMAERGSLGSNFKPSFADKSFVFDADLFLKMASDKDTVIVEIDEEPSTPELVTNFYSVNAGKPVQIDLTTVTKPSIDLIEYVARDLIFNGKHTIFCPSSMTKEHSKLMSLVVLGLVVKNGMQFTKL